MSDSDLPSQKGRLRKVSDSSDNLQISDVSSLSNVVQKQKKKRKIKKNLDEIPEAENEPMPKKEKIKKQKVQPEKKVIESNDQIIERLRNKGFCQSEEENSNQAPQQQQENIILVEDDEPKKNKKKQAGGQIKNKHKLFSNFEEQPIQDVPLAEEEFIADEKLVFEGQGTYELQQHHLNFLTKVNEYKQKVAVFNDEEKPAQEMPVRPAGIKRGISFNTNQEIITQNSELEVYIPKIQGAKNSLVEATLFLNKMKQQGYNNISTHSQPLLAKNEFQKNLKDQINHRRAKNVNFNDLMKKFQKTSFDQVVNKKDKNKPINNNSKEFNEELVDNMNDMSSDDEEVQFNEEELNRLSTPIASEDDDADDNDNEENQQNEKNQKNQKNSQETVEKENENENDESQKNKENLIVDLEAEFDIDVNESEEPDLNKHNDEEFDEELEDKPDNEDDEDNEDNEDNEQSNQQLDEAFIEDQSATVESNSLQLQREIQQKQKAAQIDIQDDDEDEEDEEEAIDEEELQNFSKLRKISKIIKERKQKQKELEEKKQKRLERMKEREEARKFLRENFLEQEAEQGSDNEDHDDVVKQIIEDDENFDEAQLEKELADMIDNNLEDLNEENEERAYRIYLKRLQEQDKNDIRKILRGEFRGSKGGKNLSQIDLSQFQNSEAERLKRMEDCIRIMEERDKGTYEGFDSEDEAIFQEKMSVEAKQEYLKERRQARVFNAHAKLKSQILMKPTENVFSQLFDEQVLNSLKMNDTKQDQEKKIQNRMLSFGKVRNQNSFIQSKTNPNNFSLFNENSINYDNSNSISLIKRKAQDRKGNALSRLFAQTQVGAGVNHQVSKSPNKVFLFKKKAAN